MSTGRIIGGRYRLANRIGRGSFGIVWRAEELLQGQAVTEVAVRIFTSEVSRSEISLLASLSHPSILAYRAVVEDAEDICLVTELADGGDAASKLQKWPDGLPLDDVLPILRSVTDALVYLHGIRWIHRDVKPANILFVRGGPKLGDVGTARALSETARKTTTASLGYAAPEVFSGAGGPGVDVYALGCTAFELLTGRLPFEGSTPELVHKHLTEAVSLPADMPAAMGEMIRGCLEKDPARRWTPTQVMEVLEAGRSRKASPSKPAAPKSEAAAAPPTYASAPAPSPSGAKGSAAPESPSRTRAPLPTPKAPPSSPTPTTAAPSAPPAAPKPAAGSKPTPLDAALKRHLASHGRRWGDPDQWKSFMSVAGPIAREHKIGERDLIRRAEALVPVVEAEKGDARQKMARVRAWVLALGSRQWSAQKWAAFLDELNPSDEYEAAATRDALLVRFYPQAAGTTRAIDLGGGLQHVLVYRTLASLQQPASHLIELLTKDKSAETIVGVWHSVQPITAREWAAVTRQAVPAGIAPESVALANRVVSSTFLEAAQRWWPLEEFRWPRFAEYEGIRVARDASTKQVALARQRAAIAQSSSTAGKILQALATTASDAMKQMKEAWLDDEDLSAFNDSANGLQMNLVSPVPRHP